MYKTKDYIRNGVMYLNNMLRPRHKMLSTLMLYSTTKCQSRCKHCSIWQKPVEHLSFKDIREIMRSKCISLHTVVGLEGGEFLLHPEADVIMEWFKENHPNYTLLSNCLNPPKVIDAVRNIHDTEENFDFVALYEEWQNGNLKLHCQSIFSELVIHSNGDVPLCQNLDVKLGNIHTHSLDDIFNSRFAHKEQCRYSKECKACWINFHRKLIYKGKQSTLMGVPIEKVYQRKRVDVHLFDRNNFVPTIHNNQIVTQGYFDTIKGFVDAVEKRKRSSEQSLEAIIDTYKLIESIRSFQNKKNI